MMRVWLDDQINDLACPIRHTPKGYVGSKSVLEVARWIKEGRVSHIDFDHDLGGVFSGYTLARFIEKLAFESKIKPISWNVHSANPIGAKNINDAMEAAERFWRDDEASKVCSELAKEKLNWNEISHEDD